MCIYNSGMIEIHNIKGVPENCFYKACDEYCEVQSLLYKECFGEVMVNLAKSLRLSPGIALHTVVYAEEGPVLNGIPNVWKLFFPGRLRLAWTFFVQPVQKILEYMKSENSQWIIATPL